MCNIKIILKGAVQWHLEYSRWGATPELCIAPREGSGLRCPPPACPPPACPLPHPGNHESTFYLCAFTSQDISCKRTHTPCGVSCLASWTWHSTFRVCPTLEAMSVLRCFYVAEYCCVIGIYHVFFIHSSVRGCLHCFCLSAIMIVLL